jgi:small conductance mechanosensitive channel
MEDNVEKFSNEILASLRENWEKFLFNLPKIVLALFIFALITFFAVRVSRFLTNRLTRKAHDQLFATFIAQVTKYVLIVFGIMLSLQILDLSGIAGGLLAGAGVSALIIGFAFKDIGENFLSGIILAFDRPFNLNDTIMISNYMGNVKALNFRTTHIKTFDEKDVYIPNAIMVKEALTNLTRDGKLRLDFLVGIAYEDNIEDAISLILRTIRNYGSVLSEPEPFSVVEEFSPSTVNIKIFFWTATEDYRKGVLLTKSDIMARVKSELIRNGFTLPANIQELKVYDKREALPVNLNNLEQVKKNLLANGDTYKQ